MPRIRIVTRVRAPIGRCFDLMRDVDVHTRSTARTQERAVGGVTSGLLGLGDTVTWEAVHFGVRQHLTVRITRCEPPYRFEDVMVRGAFHSFTHRHTFWPDGPWTVMVDDFRYRSPLGPLGILADKLFLKRYMRAFLTERARYLIQVAEAEQGA